MPVFFVVGGYANAVSWTAHHQRGEGWTSWVRGRVMRLLWPATVYVVAVVLAVTGARIAGVNTAELAQVGWFVALHLWFLPVYLLLIALTPVLRAAHRRWELAVPAVMAGGAAAVDAGVLGPHLPLIGFANYPLVWGSMHQWGFAWQDGSLTRPRWRPYALASRHGAPRRAAGLGVLPGRHDRGGRARRQYQPTVDRAAGLRRRPDRAAARGGARRSATARTRPQMAAGLPPQRHGHDGSTCGTWRP
jgi:hypothetical protein